MHKSASEQTELILNLLHRICIKSETTIKIVRSQVDEQGRALWIMNTSSEPHVIQITTSVTHNEHEATDRPAPSITFLFPPLPSSLFIHDSLIDAYNISHCVSRWVIIINKFDRYGRKWRVFRAFVWRHGGRQRTSGQGSRSSGR